MALSKRNPGALPAIGRDSLGLTPGRTASESHRLRERIRMKKFTLLGLALSACMAHAQTSLDQDPKERALSEALFSHPPVSSVDGPRLSPTQAPMSSPSQVPSHLMRLDVAQVSSDATISNGWYVIEGAGRPRERMNGFSIRIQAYPMNPKPFNGRLEVVFLSRDRAEKWSVLNKVCRAVTVQVQGQIDAVESGKGRASGWIVRLLAPDNSILGLAASTDELRQAAVDSNQFYKFTGPLQWIQE